MLFASFPYLLMFLPVTVGGAILVRKLQGSKAAQLWVLFASCFFYARTNPFSLVYLFLSVASNWTFATLMERSEQPARKRILICSVAANIAYLCVFKYLTFFASILSFVFHFGVTAPALHFPLGVSFFTITQLMYLVDCYEEALDAGSLLDHASFVTFFPYLISGPLGRAKRMRHQFGYFGGWDNERRDLLSRGVFLFSLGLFKKAAFANGFEQVVRFGNDTATAMSAVEAWIFSIAYVMEIYFDFSGYSDMAIGSALMLGIEIPRNFDAPYRAKSIIEFWQRWHISLTSFITTYLYTPILRSFKKRTLSSSALATLCSMGIAGLWHGAAWTFVVWGCLHGAFLGVNQYWRKKQMPKLPLIVSWLLTFSCVVVAEVYFQANSMSKANERVLTLFNPHRSFSVLNVNSLELQVYGLGIRLAKWPLFAGALVAILGPSSEQLGRDFKPTPLNCVYTVGALAISFALLNSTISTPFVYFRF